MPESNQMNLFPQWSPEDMQTELKTCSNGNIPHDLWKVISAFSNTDGGQLLCGVTPDNKPVGLSVSEIDKVQQDIVSLCQNGFNYQINPVVRTIGSVVVAQIPAAPATVRPIYSKSRGISNGSFIRIGSSNIQMSDEVRNQFAVAARGGAELIEYSTAIASECFNNDTVDRYIASVNESRNGIYEPSDTVDVLRKMRATDDSSHPTLFGLLAFSKDVFLQQMTAPTVNIAVTQYSSDSKVNPHDPTTTFYDNREFDGNVVEQFRAAFRFIKSKLPISGKINTDGERRDYLIIPDVALREALANAVAHRDYGTFSARIQVDIYSNRVEITNPGRSLVPIDEIEKTPSVSRNPYLMSFLKDLHITEQRARGMLTIRESTKAAGLAEPLVENLDSSFRITLYSSAFLSSEDHIWVTQFADYKLKDRQLTALIHMHNTGKSITNTEYRDINTMNNVGDDRRARHELDILSNAGIIIPSGEKRYRKYYLAEKYQ